ncbi:MAG: hypothetical protein AAF488_14640 [Planctomycetota bacterium]
MQQFVVFLGGAVLGAVLSAACGIDFFPSPLERGVSLARSRQIVSDLKRDAEGLRTDRDRALKNFRREERVASARARDLVVVRGELAEARKANRGLIGDLGGSQHRLRQANSQLASATSTISALRRDLNETEDELGLARSELRRQSFDFFSRSRGPEDRELARTFLRGDGTLEEKREFIIQLKRRSPELLLTLGDPLPRPVVAEVDEPEFGITVNVYSEPADSKERDIRQDVE